jgi:hypothetical protein
MYGQTSLKAAIWKIDWEDGNEEELKEMKM